jgi:hypothetical protein
MANTTAYYAMATITAVKSFVVQAPSDRKQERTGKILGNENAEYLI